MAGTNAVAGQKAILDRLRDELSSQSEIGISLADPGRALAREAIFGGRCAGPQDAAAFRGAGRRQRAESLIWNLYVRVADPGLTDEENAERAVELGGVVEEILASGYIQDGAGVAGMKAIEVTSFAIEHSMDDSCPISEITYTIQFRSILQ